MPRTKKPDLSEIQSLREFYLPHVLPFSRQFFPLVHISLLVQNIHAGQSKSERGWGRECSVSPKYYHLGSHLGCIMKVIVCYVGVLSSCEGCHYEFAGGYSTLTSVLAAKYVD